MLLMKSPIQTVYKTHCSHKPSVTPVAHLTSGLPCWTCLADVEPLLRALNQASAGGRNRAVGGVWGV